MLLHQSTLMMTMNDIILLLPQAYIGESIGNISKSQVISRTEQGEGLTEARTANVGRLYSGSAGGAGHAEVSPEPESGTGQWKQGTVTYPRGGCLRQLKKTKEPGCWTPFLNQLMMFLLHRGSLGIRVDPMRARQR